MRDSFRPRKSFGGNRTGSSGRGNFRDRSSGRKEMFDAICDQCGKNCKVPFRPTNSKPIYCSECFESVEKNRDNGDFRDIKKFKRSGNEQGCNCICNCEQSINQLKMELSEINQKLDQIIKITQS
ncbi:MAG TPA: hypothetical protein PLL26_01380 [Candidatus Dojkabacteria bacterium]|nr:hypothetical protein [Candidatus Dojkabacteria bacterium]